MVRVVARAVRTRQRALRRDVAVPFGAATLRLTAADSADVVALARRRPGPHNVRRRFVEQQVVRRLADQYRRFHRDLAPSVVTGPSNGDAADVPVDGGGDVPVDADGQLALFGPGEAGDAGYGGDRVVGGNGGGDGAGASDGTGFDDAEDDEVAEDEEEVPEEPEWLAEVVPMPGVFGRDVPAGTSDVSAETSGASGAGATRTVPPAESTPEEDFDLEEFSRSVRRVPEVAEALDRMWPRLAPHELLHDLFGARPLLAAAGHGILTAAEQASLFRPRSPSLDDVAWTVADAALVDEARSVLGPRRSRSRRQRSDGRDRLDRARDEVGFWPSGLDTTPTPSSGGGAGDDDPVRSYGHIVVDEVQDLSPLQLRMLARRSLSGSMTVVGDIAQATGPWAPSGWSEVASHLTPSKEPRLVELTVSYRTPAEVVAVAAGVLAVAAPGVTPPRPVRRSGHRPTVASALPAALARRVAEVAADEMVAVTGGRVAVLVPGDRYRETLDALDDLHTGAVDPRDPRGPGLAAPLVVLPADEANGLEFDAVVVMEPAAIAAGDGASGDGPAPTTRGLRALYVALTRPTRRLAVVHSVPLPAGLSLS